VPAPPNFPKKKQDPEDKLDYSNDWQAQPLPFLLPEETISTSTWKIYTLAWVEASDGATLSAGSNTDTVATIWVDSLVVGTTYYLTNHIITSEGREKDESITLICEEQ
jgi:hypothetical protein